MKKLIITAATLAALTFSTGMGSLPEGTKLQTETYIVRSGDTLWAIANRYMIKNTYGPREIHEFKEGIVELNYDRIFKGREPALIYPGDELQINYWTKDDAI